ncbi:MAG TPA: V-type ATPase subunit [Bacillota bacterium]|nr:V-type ATPase subunit [Bacillota bacterium]
MDERDETYGKKSYEYAVGTLSAGSCRPLTQEQWSRLEQADPAGMVRLLGEYGYAQKAQDVSGVIEEHLRAVRALLRDISPDAQLTGAMFFENDATNVKLYLKAEMLKRQAGAPADGYFNPETVRLCALAGDWSMLGAEAETLLGDVSLENDPFVLSCRVDNAMFSRALSVAKSKRCSALSDVLTEFARGRNRLTRERIKRLSGGDADKYECAFLPVEADGESDTLTGEALRADVDRRMKNVLTEAGYAGNMGVLAEFYFLKKAEAARLRKLAASENAGGAV